MANYYYHFHHGHILVNVDGRPCLLDTGSQLSVGYEPIRIGDRIFPVEPCYLGMTASYLSEHIGVPVEGLIGADILREYHLHACSATRTLRFDRSGPDGDTLLPLQHYSGVPLVNVWVNGRVRMMFLETGSPMSLLLPGALEGHEPEGRFEDFYPLLGNHLTPVYSFDVIFGGFRRSFRFGEVPVELRSLFSHAGAEGLIGSELFRQFDVSLSPGSRTLSLRTPLAGLDAVAG